MLLIGTTVIALFGWNVITTTPLILVIFVLFDLALLAGLIFSGTIKNELALLFCALSLFYTYSFYLEALVGLTQPDSFTIVFNLSQLGLDLVRDGASMVLASVVFRNAVLIGWWPRLARRSRIHLALTSVRVFDVVLVGSLGVVCKVAGAVTGISIISLLGGYFYIVFVAMLCVFVARRFGFGLFATLSILAVAFVGLLLMDRSRLQIVVSSLALMMAMRAVSRLELYKLVLVGLTAIILFLTFGYFREAEQDRGDSIGTGVFSQEEAGNIHLVGAHIVGMTDRGELPAELTESILPKMLRAIPGASGDRMLADQYIWLNFPDVAAAGGGFAYSIVAEMYSIFGRGGVALAGIMIGVMFSALFFEIKRPFAACASLIFLTQFLRQESAASLLSGGALIIGLFMLVTLKQIVRAALQTPYQSTSPKG